MKSASISEVKARLSHYIGIIRRGGEVMIMERGVPVARLTGVRKGARREPDRERLGRLVRAGVVASGNGDTDWLLEQEPLELDADLTSALQQEREETL